MFAIICLIAICKIMHVYTKITKMWMNTLCINIIDKNTSVYIGLREDEPGSTSAHRGHHSDFFSVGYVELCPPGIIAVFSRSGCSTMFNPFTPFYKARFNML